MIIALYRRLDRPHRLASALLAAVTVGCASRYEPIVDSRDLDQVQYQTDLTDCREYADRVDVGSGAAGGGLIGAGVGAAIGAAVGAITGSPGRGAAIGAAGGGTSGAASGGLSSAEKKRRVIRNCLSGRGYRVLD
jgi:hypothetical protein